MSFKKEFLKKFTDKKIIGKLRYESSKNLFIYGTIIFFSNYFFVGAKFYDEIFIYTLPFSFVFFLVAFGGFLYFYLTKNYNLNFLFKMILIIFLCIFVIVFLYPFIGINII